MTGSIQTRLEGDMEEVRSEAQFKLPNNSGIASIPLNRGCFTYRVRASPGRNQGTTCKNFTHRLARAMGVGMVLGEGDTLL